MNIAFFLKPKISTAYLYGDYTLRQGLEKMRRYGYSAIPVISRDGKYIGTVSEGDFLWYITDCFNNNVETNQRTLEETLLTKLIRTNSYVPMKVTADIAELFNLAMNQNFVPVTDDLGSFIGIVTRRDIIKHLTEK